jgi:hypothetical protein
LKYYSYKEEDHQLQSMHNEIQDGLSISQGKQKPSIKTNPINSIN